MQLIVLIIFIYAVKAAWDDAHKTWRKSKTAYMKSADARFPGAPKSRRAAWALRHDAGYWASQLANGLPTARHGLAAGWHDGRAAQATARAGREEARTRRLENQAGHAERLSGFRERQQEALRRWQDAMDADRGRATEGTVAGEGSEDSGEGSPVQGHFAGHGDYLEVPFEPSGTSEWTARNNAYTIRREGPGNYVVRDGRGGLIGADKDLKSAQGVAEKHANGLRGNGDAPSRPAAAPDSPEPAPRVCVACGNPENGPRSDGGNWGPLATYSEPIFDGDPDVPRLVHKSHFEDESTGFYGRPYQPAPAPDVAGQPGEDGEHAPAPADGRPKVTGVGTIGVVDGEHGPRLDLQGWVFDRHPNLGDGDHDGRGLADALNGHTVAELHEMSHGPGCTCPVSRVAEPVFPAAPSTQGEATMSAGTADVTYDGVLTSMATAKNDAEQRAAEQQQAAQRASAASEHMQALDVDPTTLSAMADHLDAHDAATKAQQLVQETADAVEAALRRGHSGLAEAHQNAPVTAADKTFYEA